MTPIAAILFRGAEDWLWPAAGLSACVAVLLVWGYRRTAAFGRFRFVAALLKAVGVAALALCLLEPLWTVRRLRPGANLFVILADNSQSLQIRDRDAEKSRADLLRTVLADEKAPWQVRLEQDFDVRPYVFDARLRRSPDFADLTFDGQASTLGLALRTIRQRFAGRPLAGVLLLTDGNATDVGDGTLDATGLPPVYPVVLGGDRAADDVGILSVAVTQTAFEDAPVSIRVDVGATGYTGATLVAWLLDEAGERKDRQVQTLAEEGKPVTFRFQVRPETAGVSFYRVRVAARDEVAQFDDPDRSREATLANNERLVAVDRGHGPYHILYVAGRPNWEYKFLRRALLEDKEVRLVGLIRVAKREPKFVYRSRRGESTNPLFRGFGNQDDEDAENYSEPVLIRLNVLEEDPSELREGFPKRADALFRYHAIVLDDVEAAFFSRDQMSLLERFVSERGGGLLMLGGQESFRGGKYARTPIADMLPVYLDRPVDVPTDSEYHLTLTREGWLAPWVRLRDNEPDEHDRLRDFPPFKTINHLSGSRAIKPGAQVLATVVAGNGQTYPALIVQRFGAGRCAALTIGDYWHAQLRQPPGSDDVAQTWRQLMRWMIADVPRRVEVEVERRRTDPDAAVRLRIRARDEVFDPLDDALVTVTIDGPSDDPLVVHAEPSLAEAGLHEAVYVPRKPGAYRAEVVVTDGSGNRVGRAQTGWAANPAADEFRSLVPNRALLEDLAQKTGGQVVALDELETFVKSLPNRKMPITDQAVHPLWHTPTVFLFALACLIAEWGLRRWRGLP